MITAMTLLDHTDPADHIKIILNRNGRVLFDSTISGDFPPDLCLYRVELITVKDGILTVYVC